MLVGVPEGVALLVLSVVGWGLRRLVAGQDETNKTLVTISDRLGQINGRVGKMETRQDMHEKHDDERHTEIGKEHDALWAAVNGRRP